MQQQTHNSESGKPADFSYLIDENFNLHSWKITSKTAGMKVHFTDNLSFADCGTACDTFNIVHIHNGIHLRKEEMQEAKSYYNKNNSAFCIWINENQLIDHTKKIIENAGFEVANTEPGMILNLATYTPKTDEKFLHIRTVSTPQEVLDFAAILARNWHPPDQHVFRYYELVAQEILSAAHKVILMLYYHQEKPVATLELFPTDRYTIGLYNLSTLAAYRGNGIGNALMIYALNKAKELGYQTAILQASEDGIRIYQRLGFTVATTYYEYQEK